MSLLSLPSTQKLGRMLLNPQYETQGPTLTQTPSMYHWLRYNIISRFAHPLSLFVCVPFIPSPLSLGSFAVLL